MENNLGLAELYGETPASVICRIVDSAFNAFDSLNTEFITLMDIQLVLLPPSEQQIFHSNLRNMDVRRLNQSGIDEHADKDAFEVLHCSINIYIYIFTCKCIPLFLFE